MPARPLAATPIAFVRAVVLAYEKYGADPREALERAQIPARLLRQDGARITTRQMERFSATAMQQLDDEALGWFSRRLPWGSLGMLCRASLSSPTLGVALKRWCRHHRLLTEDVVFSLGFDGALATFAIEERVDLGAMREFCLLTSLRNVHGYACWLIDERIPLKEVTLPFAPPPHAEVYGLLFPGPVRFGTRAAGIRFEASLAKVPVRRDERALRTMLQQGLRLTVRQYRGDKVLAQRVSNLIRARRTRACTADAISRALNLSTRSLHRHLKAEGVTLQQVKDQVRREQAIEQLCRTDRPIKDVARRVGFRSEKSFARAFRAWTGRSPAQYRARA